MHVVMISIVKCFDDASDIIRHKPSTNDTSDFPYTDRARAEVCAEI